MQYKIRTKVTGVERKTQILRAYKTGDNEVVTETYDLGWFVRLEGSWEALFIGMEEPTLAVGDVVEITLGKVE